MAIQRAISSQGKINYRTKKINFLSANADLLKILAFHLFWYNIFTEAHCVIAKTASKKIGALIRYMKFLYPEVALYLYKSTIHPCMEYCCHILASTPSCYLELSDKLQKQICRNVSLSLAASFEPLAHRQNVASLSLFYR